LVLSANLDSIMTNEGMFYDGLTSEDIARRRVEFKAEIKPGTIVAKTNRGVKLGMSQAQVRRILGPPDQKLKSKKFGADEYVYRRETKKDSEGVSTRFSNYYLFKSGKLFYIELSQDLIGGG
jgi:outer membrane protein assembly factor BamE (lipoprotein component of BamABCDE complex)